MKTIVATHSIKIMSGARSQKTRIVVEIESDGFDSCIGVRCQITSASFASLDGEDEFDGDGVQLNIVGGALSV